MTCPQMFTSKKVLGHLQQTGKEDKGPGGDLSPSSPILRVSAVISPTLVLPALL